MKKILWEINFWHSYMAGFSLLKGIDRLAALKILLIAKHLKTTKQNAQKILKDNPDRFEKVFEGINPIGLVSEKELKKIQNELNTINIEDL